MTQQAIAYGIRAHTEEEVVAHLRFLERYPNRDLVSAAVSYTIEASQQQVMKTIVDIVIETVSTAPVVRSKSHCEIEAVTPDCDSPVHVRVGFDYNSTYFKSTKQMVRIVAVAEEDTLKLVVDALNKAYAGSRLPSIDWWFMTLNGPQRRSVIMQKPHKALDEFYPWFREGIEAYTKRYMESESSILLMIGEPGTGKTSLLRHMIYENQLSAVVCYDEEVLKKDQMFLEFMLGNADILIIEDADVVLTSREHGGNKMMSCFLNVADGLIKLPRKKIVFTTNLENLASFDPALIRAGRCFDSVKFRALTHQEAVKAAHAADIDPPSEEKPYLLADLFNQSHRKVSKSVGFAMISGGRATPPYMQGDYTD